MKKKICLANGNEGKCEKEAEFVVNKKGSLSIREANYCEEHTKAFRVFPKDFEVKKI